MASFRVYRYPVVAVIILICCSFVTVHAKTASLVAYQFEDRMLPNNTVVVTATPSGNLSLSEFGTLRVVSDVLRETAENNSRVLGSVVGLVTSLKDASLYVTLSLVFESPDWNGTIGTQGVLSTEGSGELAVTGGSGDFLFAQGYCGITLVSAAQLASIVYKVIIHLSL